MRRAIDIAARGLGTTSPNPVVGCVIVKNGSVVGEGFHAVAGGPHAEVWALREAGEQAEGATAYVTLEPCDHHGRTGPCSEALLKAGISRVVVAVPDPNPLAAGGLTRLRDHGVTVETGVLRAQAERGNAHWLTYTRKRRPFVTWKFAATLDGRSAAADGTSQWITSPEARADVHRLRGQHDAIMAGIGTVLADDPHLTVRPGPATPLRIVVDTEGATPPHARVLDAAAPTLLAVGAEVPFENSVRVPRGPHGLDLPALLAELHSRRIVSVFLEGGPTLAGSFLRAGLVDRVVAYVAPAFLGSGKPALGEAGVATIGGLHRWEFEDVVPVGPDLRITARPAPPKEN